VLIGLSRQTTGEKPKSRNLLLVLILSIFTVSGHTLGILVLILISAAWLILAMHQKLNNVHILLIISAIGIGTLIGANHHVRMYLEYGSIKGVDYVPSTIRGTALHDIDQKMMLEKTIPYENKVGRILDFFSRDNYRISVPGLVLAFFFAGGRLFFLRSSNESPEIFISVLTILILLTYFGVFDLPNLRISDIFTANTRYMLHWYPLIAIILSRSFFNIFNWLKKRLPPKKTSYSELLFVISIVTLGFYSSSIINSNWRFLGLTLQKNHIPKLIAPLEEAIEYLPKGRVLFLGETDLNYYIGNQAIEMYAHGSWDLIKAKTYDEVEAAIENWQIGAVALLENKIIGWWDQIPMFDYLNDPKNTKIVPNHSGDFIIYYIE